MTRSRPWEKYYGDVPANLNYSDVSMYEMLSRTAMKYPDIPAYGFMGSTVSFKTMMGQIDGLAATLASHGVKKNDNVIICLPNCPQALLLIYAVNRCGAISNMIYPLSSKNDIAKSLKDSGCKFAVSIDSAMSAFIEMSETDLETLVYVSFKESPEQKEIDGLKIINMNDLRPNGEIPPMPEMSGKDAALVMHSGGTSGRSKGILLSNMNVNASALQAWAMFDDVEEGNCSTLTVMPLFHGFGLVGNLHTIIIHGGCCHMIPRFDPSVFAESIRTLKPNVIMGVPTLYEYLLAYRLLNGADLSFVTAVVSGGDTLTPTLRTRVEKMFLENGADIVMRDGYGLTECVMLTCITPRNNYKEGYIGIPCPDMFFKIVKVGTEEELPSDEAGQICISGPTVMQSFQTEKEEIHDTIKIHSDGMKWLHTGDLGVMSDDGFVAYRGRIDRMIVTSGYNVYPNQVEDVLNSHPAVEISCVIGIPDDIKKFILKAFVVLKNGKELTDSLYEEIRKYCQDNLPRYSIPKVMKSLKSMPRTKIGKISYKDLESM